MNEAEQLLYRYYEEDNYEVIDIQSKKKNKQKLCYVFFSSNGLYKDRNDIDVIKKMHETDRYEWKFISENKKIRKNASRIIFLRDIFKIFYIRGISKKINSIDKIVQLLEELTAGMNVVLAGSSAGAYMALLIGNMIPNCYKVLSLGGIVDLDDWKDFSEYFVKYLNLSDYYNIKSHLYGKYWTINFYGAKNSVDLHNADLINHYSNNKKLINVGFDDKEHAPRPSGDDLIKLLVCTDKYLKKIKMRVDKKNNVTETAFSMANIGVLRTCWNKTKAKMIKCLKRKKHEKDS